jgi:uncharacterized protein (TIGR00299 family) protein
MNSDKSTSEPLAKILFLEPFSGISGDMLLGALLDLGLDLPRLEHKLGLLSLGGYRLSATPCSRAGIRALRFEVHCEEHEENHHDVAHGRGHDPHHDHDHDHNHNHGHDHDHGRGFDSGRHHDHAHPHRNFRDIREMIASSGLSPWARQKAVEAFGRLAAAEGEIHGCPPDEVHFHEVGAVDSIVDMVGAVVAIEELMPVRVISADVNVGQGVMNCRHGKYPAPGPATLALLKGIPIYASANSGELTTPTGAALLATLVESYGPRPKMKVSRIGYGAGSRDFKDAANVLRLSLGEDAAAEGARPQGSRVAVIEATLDDMNPQIYGYFQERALEAGALDVFAVPAFMKKNRPGMMITVICDPDKLDEMAELMLTETTTLGIRHSFSERKVLAREFLQVQTEYGPVTVKVSSLAGRSVHYAPEYECCRRLARERGVALKDVLAAASRAYLNLAR